MPLKNKINLMNENYGDGFKEHLLKQYEIFVESSEQISLKRMSTNKFYLAVNTGIFAIAGYLTILTNPLIAILLSILGIFLCLSWINSLSSYRRLNKAKFKIIHQLEEKLPANLFMKEDEYLNKYYTLTNLERFIPSLFIIFYGVIILWFSPQIITDLIKNINGGF
jgi:uncharacterized membrane protein